MKWLSITLVLSALALSGAAQSHELTFSHVDVRLQHEATLLTVKLPIKALMHEPSLSLFVGTTEQSLHTIPLTADVQKSLTELLANRLRITSNGATLPLIVTSTRQEGDDIAITVSGPPVHGVLEVRANLFPQDPLHKVFVNVYRQEMLLGQFALDRQDSTFDLAAPERSRRDVFATFLREGIYHIFIGPDHIVFILALILLGGSLWSQINIISAFTVAHSITLALAALNFIHLPSRLVESGIALSVVVVGLHDLQQLRHDKPPTMGRDLRLILAFGFGLLHGFGFAGVLAELDLPKQALVWSLAAFNFGVEIGQVAIVLLAAPILGALRQFVPPRIVHIQMSAMASAVVLVGSFWLVQRVFGA